MLIRFTYPVKTSMVLTDYWPVLMGDMKIEWIHEDDRIAAVSGTVPADKADRPPKWTPSSAPGVLPSLNPGWSNREQEVEEGIRTLRGLLSLFCHIEIDFERVKTDWVPETDDERKLVTVNGFSRATEKPDLLQPRRLAYDIVARAMLSVKAASHYEIPLGFLRRGTSAIHAGQYIEAFYNLFFFLETQFAGGYSNPRVTMDKLWSADAVRAGVAKAREPVARDRHLDPRKRATLLQMTDEELVRHLVTIRGNLHHHSLRKPGVWHPDKTDQFQEEAILLQHIVHSIAMQDSMSWMFSPDRDHDLMRSAQAAGTVAKVRIEATYLMNGKQTTFGPVVIELPSRHIDFAAIDAVHRHFREQFKGDHPKVELLEYKFLSEDGGRVYAVWKRAGNHEDPHLK